VSAVKIAILTVVLGTPFGVAAYQDFVTGHPEREVREEMDRLAAQEWDQLDDWDELDDLDYAPTPSGADALVDMMPRAPIVVPARSFAGIDGVSARDDMRADGDGTIAAGTFLTIDGGGVEETLVRAWGEPTRALDVNGVRHAHWWSADGYARATLTVGETTSRLLLRPYSPLSTWTDEASNVLGQPIDLLVFDADEVGNPFERIEPPLRDGESPTRIQVFHEGGTIVRYVIHGDYYYQPERSAELAQIYGERDNMTLDDQPARAAFTLEITKAN
jgi:hypothetical protein